MQDHRLQQARIKIDQIDAAMAELFEQRMAAVREVIAYKIDHQLPILDASREEAVIEKGCDRIQENELKEYYRELLVKQMELSRRYQQTLLAAAKKDGSCSEP